VRVSALRALDATQLEPRYREHVTLYLYEQAEKYSLQFIEPKPAEARPWLRLCIDHPADLELVRAVARHFGSRRDFTLGEIVHFLVQHPAIAAVNDAYKAPAAGGQW
jgi:spore coat polysaccharide biosynthesis protein SpsF